MHRNPLRSSAMTYASGLVMSAGALLYLIDRIQSARNWHLLLIPAVLLMVLGSLLALGSSISNRRSVES